jgi:hypothetical protein
MGGTRELDVVLVWEEDDEDVWKEMQEDKTKGIGGHAGRPGMEAFCAVKCK